MPATSQHLSQHDYSRRLGFRLRRLRLSRGLTQERVAEQAGIAPYTYQKFERGESRPGTPMNPRLSTLLALADVFGIGIGELLAVEYDSRGESAQESDGS